MKLTPILPFTGKALTVLSVDLQNEKNRETHHTSEFEHDYLIVRRGQEFTFNLTFDRKVNKDADVLFAKFAYGILSKWSIFIMWNQLTI